MAWRLRRHECWQQYRYLLPEAPSHSDPTLSVARQGPDLLTAQSLLAQITYAQGCGTGPSAHHLVLVNRADLFLRLRDHLNRRASSQAPPELSSVLADSPEVAVEALSRLVQLETTIRAAGATARTFTLWQNGVGFLSTDQDGHARATGETRHLCPTLLRHVRP